MRCWLFEIIVHVFLQFRKFCLNNRAAIGDFTISSELSPLLNPFDRYVSRIRNN